MSSEVRRDSKRMQAARLLEEAGELLIKAGETMVTAAQALHLIEQAEKRVTRAARTAESTTFTAEEMDREKPKTLHDGLPANIREKIQRRADSLKALAQEIRDLPVTKHQRALKGRRKGGDAGAGD